MTKEFNSIDKKTLIIYSLILIAVVVVSAIFISSPFKKDDQSSTVNPIQNLAVSGSGTTELNGYKIRQGWQIYKGVTFDINYPLAFTPKASSSYDAVTFSSADTLTKLSVFVATTPGATPTDFAINESVEDMTDSISGKSPSCNASVCTREIFTGKAKDNSYSKKVIINKNNTGKTTSAFVFQYPSSTPEVQASEVFSNFQESLAKHASSTK